MSKNLLLPCPAILLTYSTVAQPKLISKRDGKTISTTSIDKIITQLMDAAEVTVLLPGIINDNKVACLKSNGKKNAANNEWIDNTISFYAASVANPLFAYLLMQLTDEDVIEPDKPLNSYLPKPLTDYENYKDLVGNDRWKLITARHCLSHTTGFPNWRWFNPKGNEKLEIYYFRRTICLFRRGTGFITNGN